MFSIFVEEICQHDVYFSQVYLFHQIPDVTQNGSWPRVCKQNSKGPSDLTKEPFAIVAGRTGLLDRSSRSLLSWWFFFFSEENNIFFLFLIETVNNDVGSLYNLWATCLLIWLCNILPVNRPTSCHVGPIVVYNIIEVINDTERVQ